MNLRTICLFLIVVLYALSVPWYRTAGEEPELWLGLPDLKRGNTKSTRCQNRDPDGGALPSSMGLYTCLSTPETGA